MVTSPFDYVRQVQNPLQNSLAVLAQGKQQKIDQGILEGNQAVQQQQLQQRDTLFQQGQQDRALGQQQAAQAAQQQAITKAELAELTNNPNTRAEDYVQFSIRNPGIGDAIRESVSSMEEGEKVGNVRTLGQVYAAMDGGNVDFATGILEDRVEAMRNSGRDQEADLAQGTLDLIKINPAAAKTSLGISLAAIDENFAETFGKLEDQRRLTDAEPWVTSERADDIKKRAADLDKTKAETTKLLAESRKLGVAEMQALLDYETALKNPGGASEKDRFDYEDKLRKQYVAATQGFAESQVTLDRLTDSATAKSGPGDAALIFSFMKMLDPGSVVRESEFAIAQNTDGLLSRLAIQAENLAKDEKYLLSDTQRKEFVSLANKYMEGAASQEKRVRDRLMNAVNSYSLSADNVFGQVDAPIEEPEGLTPDQQVEEILRGLGGN